MGHTHRMAPRQTDPQYKLRLTPELKERLDEAAKDNNRSLNSEILARLEGSFASEETLKGLMSALAVQERYSKALAAIQEAYAEMALILGSAALSPERAEEMRKNNPGGIERITDVFARQLAEIRADKAAQGSGNPNQTPENQTGPRLPRATRRWLN